MKTKDPLSHRFDHLLVQGTGQLKLKASYAKLNLLPNIPPPPPILIYTSMGVFNIRGGGGKFLY